MRDKDCGQCGYPMDNNCMMERTPDGLRHLERQDCINKTRKARDQAYKERNTLVLLLSKIFPSWLGRHPEEDKDWEDDWRWIVFIMLPTGQCSWHIHDTEWEDFACHLVEVKEKRWDGHSTEEKYRRIEQYQPLDECFFCGMRLSNPGHIVEGKLACNQ